MSAKRTKHLGVLIAYGTEVRSFVHSGLLHELAKKYRITIFALKPDSQGFGGLPPSVSLVPFPIAEEHPIVRKWRYRSDRVHALWLEKIGTKRWRYTLPQEKKINAYKKLRDHSLKVISSSSVTELLFGLENVIGKIWGSNTNWEFIFNALKIDAIISLGYLNERSMPALQTAMNMGLKTLIFMHTWKDVFVKPHVPIIPSKIMVWCQSHVEKLLEFNPWLKQENIRITGSLHLEPFTTLTRLMPEKQFYQITGLDPRRPFICYTAAGPKAVLHEEGVIEFLLEAIKDNRISHRPQLLLRINPMENGQRFKALENLFSSDLVIQKPKWEWHPEINWNCPLEGDSGLWVSTAYYASLNVSIPSTVTLEFAAIGRPVINVCFDIEQVASMELSNQRYWDTDWYSEIRSLNIVTPVFSGGEMINAINNVLSKEMISMKNKNAKNLSWLNSNATSLASDMIDEELL